MKKKSKNSYKIFKILGHLDCPHAGCLPKGVQTNDSAAPRSAEAVLSARERTPHQKVDGPSFELTRCRSGRNTSSLGWKVKVDMKLFVFITFV